MVHGRDHRQGTPTGVALASAAEESGEGSMRGEGQHEGGRGSMRGVVGQHEGGGAA